MHNSSSIGTTHAMAIVCRHTLLWDGSFYFDTLTCNPKQEAEWMHEYASLGNVCETKEGQDQVTIQVVKLYSADPIDSLVAIICDETEAAWFTRVRVAHDDTIYDLSKGACSDSSQR